MRVFYLSFIRWFHLIAQCWLFPSFLLQFLLFLIALSVWFFFFHWYFSHSLFVYISPWAQVKSSTKCSTQWSGHTMRPRIYIIKNVMILFTASQWDICMYRIVSYRIICCVYGLCIATVNRKKEGKSVTHSSANTIHIKTHCEIKYLHKERRKYMHTLKHALVRISYASNSNTQQQ